MSSEAFGTREIVMLTVVIPVVSAIALAWWRVTVKAMRLVVTQSITSVVKGEFEALHQQLTELAVENDASHSEAMGRLDRQGERLDHLGAELVKHQERIDQLDIHLARLNEQLDRLDRRFEHLKSEVDGGEPPTTPD